MTFGKNQEGFSAVELVIVVAVVGVLAFGAWRIVDMRSDKNKNPVSSHELPSDLTDVKPMDEIVGLAAQDIGQLQVVTVRLELKNADLIYFIKLSDGKVLAYNAKTGVKVQQTTTDDDSEKDDDGALPAGYKPAISLQAATQTAQGKRPGKTITKVSLELEDGIAVYSVRFSDKGRVDVDAATGDALRVKEPGKPDVKLRDDDNDIDDDKNKNGIDSDDDNDGTIDSNDDDNEGDGVNDAADSDDDNDGVNDDKDDDSGNSGSGSSNSGGGSDHN